MKRFLLCLFLAALSPAIAAASATAYVEGKVIDASTGKPVQGVHVTVQSPTGTAGAVSDRNGFYMVWDAPIGQATLSFSHDGFMQSAGTVCLHPGATDASTIALYDRLGGESSRAEFQQWRSLSRYLLLEDTTNATWLGPC
ncbi:MAG TPA: carboxypeptidase regulatory-like domain-containing protein [Candidatus Baltobacteraceae bacterium]|jgi:hypothetical protein|nr:carboxypeptidase regulatory-like domain-containing protein [Candidatus Baltobacteraceae bacterium]